jgi:hypothetical protein
MSALMTVSYRLYQSAIVGFETGMKAFPSQALIARCFIHITAFPERSESARLIITALLPQAQNLNVEIPLVREPKLGFLYWFEISLAMLPGIPLRFAVHDPVGGKPYPDVVIELVHDRIQAREENRDGVFIDEGEGTFVEEDFGVDGLGYGYLQIPWLLQLGACLVHQHDPKNAYQVVRFHPDRQLYGYHLRFVSEKRSPQGYHCFHPDFSAIEWEHAVDLKRFALGFFSEERETVMRPQTPAM